MSAVLSHQIGAVEAGGVAYSNRHSTLPNFSFNDVTATATAQFVF